MYLGWLELLDDPYCAPGSRGTGSSQDRACPAPGTMMLARPAANRLRDLECVVNLPRVVHASISGTARYYHELDLR
jgi:hypothetical protein